MTLDNILKEIKKADSIVLLGHENPDGDAVGSCLAMKLGIQLFLRNRFLQLFLNYCYNFQFYHNLIQQFPLQNVFP